MKYKQDKRLQALTQMAVDHLALTSKEKVTFLSLLDAYYQAGKMDGTIELGIALGLQEKEKE